MTKIQALNLNVSENISKFPPIMSLKAFIAKVNGHQNMANLDPKDTVGRIYVGDQDIATYSIYISCAGLMISNISTTRVPIQLAQKPYAAFPFTYVCLT